jgi:hypothetical protein
MDNRALQMQHGAHTVSSNPGVEAAVDHQQHPPVRLPMELALSCRWSCYLCCVGVRELAASEAGGSTTVLVSANHEDTQQCVRDHTRFSAKRRVA